MKFELYRNKACPICRRHFYINPNFVGYLDCDNCGGKFYHDQLLTVDPEGKINESYVTGKINESYVTGKDLTNNARKNNGTIISETINKKDIINIRKK